MTMNKYFLCAAFTSALATGVLAQSASTGGNDNPSTTAAAPSTTQSTTPTIQSTQSSVAPSTSGEQRAKELQSTMEIRKWQAGPSAGDQAANINGTTDPMPSSEQRAVALQSQMEIRSWQTGPSSGDATARIDAAQTNPPPSTAPVETSKVQNDPNQKTKQ
jgi:hypothetical protein